MPEHNYKQMTRKITCIIAGSVQFGLTLETETGIIINIMCTMHMFRMCFEIQMGEIRVYVPSIETSSSRYLEW